MEGERQPDVPALLASGVTLAAIAFVVGRLLGNVYLVPPCRKLLGARELALNAAPPESSP